MQCKDIPDYPILEFLHKNASNLGVQWWNLIKAFPSQAPDKLALAKMRVLIGRGLVSGCCCGCRGDFELTKKGREYMESARTKTLVKQMANDTIFPGFSS